MSIPSPDWKAPIKSFWKWQRYSGFHFGKEFVSSICRHWFLTFSVPAALRWKSGVAAEVIGLPDHSIGERLYLSKIYLETADLFAWTLVIITISALFERIVLYLISRLCPPSADTLLKGESSRETADRSSV